MATPAVSGVPAFLAASAASGTDCAATGRPLPPADTAATGGEPPAGLSSRRETVPAGTTPTPLDKAIALANSSLQAWSTGMRFDVDPASGRTVVSITDGQTGEVLRTVPTDAVLRVAKMIVQMQEKSIDVKA